MSYYILDPTYEPKITGINDGSSQGFFKKKGFSNPKLYERIYDFFIENKFKKMGQTPDFEPVFEYVEIKKKAKLLDFMRLGPNMAGAELLVSENTQSILNKFALPEHRYYSANLFQKEQLITSYKLFHILPFNFSVIDFEASVFLKGSKWINHGEIKFKNSTEFKNYKGVVHFEKLSINDKTLKGYDILNFGIVYGKYFITERMKNAIEEAGLTGMDILPMNTSRTLISFDD